MKKFFSAGLFWMLCGFIATAYAEDKVELTIYNQDFALVKEVFQGDLKKGVSPLALEGVAALMDPTSVHIKSLTAPLSFQVVEQNFEYDLVNYGRLLEKYVGKEVEVHQTSDDGKGHIFVQKGRLLSSGYQLQPNYGGGRISSGYQYVAGGSPIVEIGGKIHTAINGYLVLPELPKDFVIKPTLRWQIQTGKSGKHDLQLSYLTSGIQWISDYVATVDDKDQKIDLVGWVTIDNRSGTAYENAKLKLVAGDVNRVQNNQPMMVKSMRAEAMMMDAGMAPQFQEQSFFEYHLYALQRAATVKNNEMKQIEMMSAAAVPVKKIYKVENGSKPQVKLEFSNKKENGMGLPLPKGRVRLYKKDSDGSLQFIGEDQIEHTPKDEKLSLLLGNVFDLAVERQQTNYNQIQPGKIWEETWEIKLRNRKEENIQVLVSESFYGGREWKIVKNSHPFEKKNAQTLEALVDVPKGQEVIFRYTVKYNA